MPPTLKSNRLLSADQIAEGRTAAYLNLTARLSLPSTSLGLSQLSRVLLRG
jgi:hypothetical protein